MGTDMLGLETLIEKIAAFSKDRLENGDISGPRFSAYVKLSWCAGSGEPCFSSCKSILDALQALRDAGDDDETSQLFIAMNAQMTEAFGEVEEPVFDLDTIRQLSAEIAKVA